MSFLVSLSIVFKQMKSLFKILLFLTFFTNLVFADCTSFSNFGSKANIQKINYPELYDKHNLSGKDFIFSKGNDWYIAYYRRTSQSFESGSSHACGEGKTLSVDSFYLKGSKLYYVVSHLGNLNTGGKPDPRYNAYQYEFYTTTSIQNPCKENEIFNVETKQCDINSCVKNGFGAIKEYIDFFYSSKAYTVLTNIPGKPGKDCYDASNGSTYCTDNYSCVLECENGSVALNDENLCYSHFLLFDYSLDNTEKLTPDDSGSESDNDNTGNGKKKDNDTTGGGKDSGGGSDNGSDIPPVPKPGDSDNLNPDNNGTGSNGTNIDFNDGRIVGAIDKTNDLLEEEGENVGKIKDRLDDLLDSKDYEDFDKKDLNFDITDGKNLLEQSSDTLKNISDVMGNTLKDTKNQVGNIKKSIDNAISKLKDPLGRSISSYKTCKCLYSKPLNLGFKTISIQMDPCDFICKINNVTYLVFFITFFYIFLKFTIFLLFKMF